MGNVNQTDKYQKLVKGVEKQNVHWQTLSVSVLNEGCLIDEFAKEDYFAIETKVSLNGGRLNFSVEEYKQFCRTFVIERTKWVNGVSCIHPKTPGMYIPAFISVILLNIGQATDYSLGIQLTPEIPKDKNSMDIKQIQRISSTLKNIQGFDGSTEMPQDKSGCFDFMSMQLVQTKISQGETSVTLNEVQHHNADSHPVYAFLSSVVGTKLVTTAIEGAEKSQIYGLDAMVRYGNTDMYGGLLCQVTSV